MDFAVKARSELAVAPKDVKTLECIRPSTEPTMGERYAAVVDKENKEWTSLIAATRSGEVVAPSGERTADNEEGSDTDKKEALKNKKKRAKKSRQPAPPAPAVDDELMKVQDMVKEGVDWSSDEDA